MKVLLVDLLPRSRLFKVPLWMPLFLTPSAALLRSTGCDVCILERGQLEEEEGYRTDRVLSSFRRRIEKFEPDLVFFDVRAEILTDFAELGRLARDGTASATILAGGRHPTLLPKETLDAYDFLDGVVIGEPEAALSTIAAGGQPGHVPGTAGRVDGDMTVTPGESPTTDLDHLPFPAWDLLDMNYYTRATPRVIPCKLLRTATVASSRGCDGHCSFCSEGRQYTGPVRFHSARYVASMIEKLSTDYDIEGIYFADEMFLADPGRTEELCAELIRSGLSKEIVWTAQVRTDAVSPESLSLMKGAGCIQLEFGIESGSQRMLNLTSKGISVERNAAALDMCRRKGIRSMASVMYGLPDETEEDILATARFIDRADPNIVRLVRNIPIPGTPLTNRLVASGRLRSDFWSHQVRRGDPFGGEAVNVTAMSDEELDRASRMLYSRCCLRRYLKDFTRCAGWLRFPSIFRKSQALRFAGHRVLPALFP